VFTLYYSNGLSLTFLRIEDWFVNVKNLGFFCIVSLKRKWEILLSAPLAEGLCDPRVKKTIKRIKAVNFKLSQNNANIEKSWRLVSLHFTCTLVYHDTCSLPRNSVLSSL
jgi:hypothetical protein